jgi:hypothetical protein
MAADDIAPAQNPPTHEPGFWMQRTAASSRRRFELEVKHLRDDLPALLEAIGVRRSVK